MKRYSQQQAARILSPWIDSASPVLLGEGMEGAVYEIDESRVAKIWFSGNTGALNRTSAFYNALASKPLTFAVPRIEEVCEIDGQIVSIEKRLAGASLSEAVASDRVSLADAQSMFVDVLAELSASGGLPEARELSVLDEGSSFFDGGEDFPDALARLAGRRLGRFLPVLSHAVEALEEKAAALATRLHDVDSGKRTVVHGDMILANILVDDEGRGTAVLDWGFFTTEGDPVFDASVAAAIFNMYGDDALNTELGLYDLIEDRLGHSRVAMLVYRAAYSLITANAYDPEGKDGHFAWCAAALNRPDVTSALLG